MEDDVELWHEFIKRDIPRWDEYDLPEQSDCWYDIYCDLRERVQKAVEEDAEKLKMALDGINSERAKHSAKFVDRRSIPLPRERPTAKQRYASFDRKMGGITPKFSSPRSGLGSSDPGGASAWSYDRPYAPRTDTKRKSNIFNVTKRNSVLAIPTKQLNNRATRVKQAPRALIEEHRRPAEPAVPHRKGPPTLIAPGRLRPSSTPAFGVQGTPVMSASLREREARLRALTSGKPSTPSASKSPESSSATARATLRASSSAAASTSLRNSQASVPIADRPLGAREATIPGEAGSATPGTNYDTDDPRALAAPPPRVVMRKRPAPSVFIQPKKKKVN